MIHSDPILKITADGSPTLYSIGFQATYHSLHGALQESQHVFILLGLKACMDVISDRPLRIFEMGFGTGLNAWLTYISGAESGRDIVYHAIENHPLSDEIIRQLHYATSRPDTYDRVFRDLHALPWNQLESVSTQFQLLKEKGDILVTPLPDNIDLVYYDAFGPETQPELWTTSQLDRICSKLSPGGLFVTYCAKGVVGRSLVDIGLKVERLPGPPGKREMLRAQRLL